MADNLSRQLIKAHLLEGDMTPGEEIGLRIDQTLTQDATGTMVMLELEAMGLKRAKTELSAQYVDHNLIQQDHRNPDDHRFLFSACQRFGIWFSGAGNGVSHPVHMQRFGKPGKTLLGSDSHTPAAGSLAMLAIGAGGIDVAQAIAGEPFYTKMPKIWGVKLTGELSDWVSAKDVILEMLRRHGTDGARGKIIEYYGPGLDKLTAMDRHVIANMGAELGATSSVFPSDEATRHFLRQYGREEDWQPMAAEDGCEYDEYEELDLGEVVPLIAKPSSPGNVVPVSEVAGESIYQAYIGSSANPGYRDFAMVAMMVRDETISPQVSLDINPTSRALLEALTAEGHLMALLTAGARLHQAGCNGCIGMGQAPASDQNSLRTTPRNFPGRSGTREDRVWLCSPETAAASALKGRITDPRDLDKPYPKVMVPARMPDVSRNLFGPLDEDKAQQVELIKGPNIATLPQFEALPDAIDMPVLLKLGDNITTDEIMPAGARVLPFRSNVPKIADFVFDIVDERYTDRARDTGDHVIIAGRDYGQGSSREHAAIAPRYLGLRAVAAKSFARIAWQNMVSFGMLPLIFTDDADYEQAEAESRLKIDDLRGQLQVGETIKAQLGEREVRFEHGLSQRQIDMLKAGGIINQLQAKQ